MPSFILLLYYIILYYIIKCDLNLVNKSVFQILEFHQTTEINNKWKP
jgi:hypothetical protein